MLVNISRLQVFIGMFIFLLQAGLRAGLRTMLHVFQVFFAAAGAGLGKRFAGQQVDGMRFRVVLHGAGDMRFAGGRGYMRSPIGMVGGTVWGMLVRMVVIVIFEIFENVADVQEGVAIKADVDESRLHTGKDASDFPFIDAADESELFFALDVNFY
jgi:hypothetical protein